MTTTNPSRVRALLAGLRFIGRRLAQERITQTAASLTFTTVISLVPLLAVMLAVFTAFPAFDELRERLQYWFAQCRANRRPEKHPVACRRGRRRSVPAPARLTPVNSGASRCGIVAARHPHRCARFTA